jgi:hypothetical protein
VYLVTAQQSLWLPNRHGVTITMCAYNQGTHYDVPRMKQYRCCIAMEVLYTCNNHRVYAAYCQSTTSHDPMLPRSDHDGASCSKGHTCCFECHTCCSKCHTCCSKCHTCCSKCHTGYR